MKTFLKILLLVVALVVVVKLLPVALGLACLVAAAFVVLGGLGVSLFGVVLGAGLVAVVVLAPIWLLVLAIMGAIALVRGAARMA